MPSRRQRRQPRAIRRPSRIAVVGRVDRQAQRGAAADRNRQMSVCPSSRDTYAMLPRA
ncbi:MAG: hypothetical protein U0703_05510 [Anaerolineae bacterium]